MVLGESNVTVNVLFQTGVQAVKTGCRRWLDSVFRASIHQPALQEFLS